MDILKIHMAVTQKNINKKMILLRMNHKKLINSNKYNSQNSKKMNL